MAPQVGKVAGGVVAVRTLVHVPLFPFVALSVPGHATQTTQT